MSFFQTIANNRRLFFSFWTIAGILLLLTLFYAIATFSPRQQKLFKDQGYFNFGQATQKTVFTFSLPSDSFAQFPSKIASYKVNPTVGIDQITSVANNLGLKDSPKLNIDKNYVWVLGNKKLIFEPPKAYINFSTETDQPISEFAPEESIKEKALQILDDLGASNTKTPPLVTGISYSIVSKNHVIPVTKDELKKSIATISLADSISGYPIITEGFNQSTTTLSLTSNNEVFGLEKYFIDIQKTEGEKSLKNLESVRSAVGDGNYILLSIEHGNQTLEDKHSDISPVANADLDKVELVYFRPVKTPQELIPVFVLSGSCSPQNRSECSIKIAVEAQN